MTAILLVLYFLVSAVISGASMDVWWSWFIQPVFPGAPNLSIGTALGLMFVITYMTQSASLMNQDDETDATYTVLKGVGFMTLFWIVALVYHYVFGIGA